MKDAFDNYGSSSSVTTLPIQSEESVPLTHKVLTATFNYSNMQYYGFNVVDDLSLWAACKGEGEGGRREREREKKEEKRERDGEEGIEKGEEERGGKPCLFIISDAASLTSEPVGRERDGRALPGNVSLIVNCQEDTPNKDKYKGM